MRHVVHENTTSLPCCLAEYTALKGLNNGDYTLLFAMVVKIIRHHAVRGVTTISHYADLQDRLYGIMRFEV